MPFSVPSRAGTKVSGRKLTLPVMFFSTTTTTTHFLPDLLGTRSKRRSLSLSLFDLFSSLFFSLEKEKETVEKSSTKRENDLTSPNDNGRQQQLIILEKGNLSSHDGDGNLPCKISNSSSKTDVVLNIEICLG